MKMCLDHWNEISEGIKSRGLWGLVSKGGKEAAERLDAQSRGGGPENLDPLRSAHNFFSIQALEQAGAYLLTGDYCPLCEYTKHATKKGAVTAAEWIADTLDKILAHCQDQRLVPGSQ